MVIDDLELGILPPASLAQTTACHQVQHFHVGSASLMFAGRALCWQNHPQHHTQLLLVFLFEIDWALYRDSKTPNNQSTVDSMNLESGYLFASLNPVHHQAGLLVVRGRNTT